MRRGVKEVDTEQQKTNEGHYGGDEISLEVSWETRIITIYLLCVCVDTPAWLPGEFFREKPFLGKASFSPVFNGTGFPWALFSQVLKLIPLLGGLLPHNPLSIFH